MFALYSTHLKSHFVPTDEDPVIGAAKANQRRLLQAEVIADIVEKLMRPDSRFIFVGDLNDPPDSPYLEPLRSPQLLLNNTFINPHETRPPKNETEGQNPQTPAWTYRHKEAGQPPQHLLYDQIWLSAALIEKQVGACIDRRTKH